MSKRNRNTDRNTNRNTDRSPHRSAGNLPAKLMGLNPDCITNAVSATTYKPGFSHKGTERSRNATISDAIFQKELKAYREQQAKKYSKASE